MPDIEGKLGFPHQHEPSYDKTKYAKKETALNLSSMLMEQMQASNRYKHDRNLREKTEDNKYLSSFRVAKNSLDFRHTTGNMGQLFSSTQQELDRLKDENRNNAEIWKS